MVLAYSERRGKVMLEVPVSEVEICCVAQNLLEREFEKVERAALPEAATTTVAVVDDEVWVQVLRVEMVESRSAVGEVQVMSVSGEMP